MNDCGNKLNWDALHEATFTQSEVKVKVAQSCPTLCDPTAYTVHGILQARILEWVAFPFSRASSQSRDWTQVWIVEVTYAFLLSLSFSKSATASFCFSSLQKPEEAQTLNSQIRGNYVQFPSLRAFCSKEGDLLLSHPQNWPSLWGHLLHTSANSVFRCINSFAAYSSFEKIFIVYFMLTTCINTEDRVVRNLI